jgi:hypothetical protein
MSLARGSGKAWNGGGGPLPFQRFQAAGELIALGPQGVDLLLALGQALLQLRQPVVKLGLLRIQRSQLLFQVHRALPRRQEPGEENVDGEDGEQHARRHEKPRDRGANAIRHEREF